MRAKKITNKLVFLKPLISKEKQQIDLWNKDVEVSMYREVGMCEKKILKSIDFGIYDNETGNLIGSLGISSIDLENNHAEIGMAIGDKNYWDKGFGTDTVKAVLDHCFNELGLNKIYLDVWEENIRAINCYLKCGFKKEGVLRQHVRKDNVYYDKWIMSVLRKEWNRIV